ncbi:hypothetical protein M0Q28_02320 [Patescibacteria group bacterium]|nr:hypothetical protein [Patescibacteria group bacterium]
MAKKPTIGDVLEAVNGLASHMDERFAELDQKFATKQELQQGLGGLENRVVTEIDRFVVLHQTLDVELVSLRSRCDRIEDRLERNNIN